MTYLDYLKARTDEPGNTGKLQSLIEQCQLHEYVLNHNQAQFRHVAQGRHMAQCRNRILTPTDCQECPFDH